MGDNPEKAKEAFRLVQQAYEVLSDPQERAWYDNHREAILRGLDEENREVDGIDIFKYFTPSCYSGYGDNDQGFTVFIGNYLKHLKKKMNHLMMIVKPNLNIP